MKSKDNAAVLQAAFGRGEIVVLYQPQVTAADSKLNAVECLVRLQHPERGLLPPAEFLPAIENDEVAIQAMGHAVLRQACRDAASWPGLSIGVNISPVQFRLPHLADSIVEIANEESFPLDRLELEILETAYFENPAHMRDVLTGLRTKGVRIALDDFGTGYSSLSALLELPLDKLKIDASFVKKSDTIRSASIIHAIVALARGIGLKVTAEGVETEQQRSFLRAAGCHYLQGYLFSKPVSALAIGRMIANDRLQK